MSAGEVASRFSITQPAVSQHLKVLRDTGLVSERRDGTRRLYSVRAEGLADLNDFLAEVLPGGLERLKAAAEAEHRRADARRASRNQHRRARGQGRRAARDGVRLLHRSHALSCIGSLTGMELAVREHFAGYRPHTAALSGAAGVAAASAAEIAGRSLVPSMAAGLVAFLLAAAWLRRAFQGRRARI